MGSTAGFSAPPGFRDSPNRALTAGEVVASTYQIKDEIARTDTGLVYEARDMLLDRLVAFKLAWRDPGSPSLMGEARRCAVVRDPCAVAIHGMGAHNGIEYVVGERVTGTLLASLTSARRCRPTSTSSACARSSPRSRACTRRASRSATCRVGRCSSIPRAAWCSGPKLSLSQVPAFGRHERIIAPEVARGEVLADDPLAAEMIDLYNVGCVAIELARGSRPFADDDVARELAGHASEPPPRLADLRPDLPAELSDLVEWMLAKQAAARPRSAQEVLLELDAVVDRLGTGTRAVRILVIDHDTARARKLWSLARRAHPAVVVETASEGGDAAHKLNRDQPDVVFISANLRGVMNLLELAMYVRGLEGGARFQLVAMGSVPDRDRALLDQARVASMPDDPHAFVDRIRAAATGPRRSRPSSRLISG